MREMVKDKAVGVSRADGTAHVEAVSPELTPDQRAEYAQRLGEHAAHGSGGGS